MTIDQLIDSFLKTTLIDLMVMSRAGLIVGRHARCCRKLATPGPSSAGELCSELLT